MQNEGSLSQAPTITNADQAPRVSEFKRFRRVFFGRWVVILGIVIMLLLLIASIFAPWLAPYDPIKSNMTESLQNPSLKHILGTDILGRDVLSRIIYGARVSLMVGVIATSIAAIVGMSMGLLAGYFRGWINNVIMRITDALMSIPPIMLALAIAAVLGGGLKNVMISVGISLIPTYCRLMCGQILSIKESDYITAAILSGASHTRVMLKHLLPNSFPPILVLITLNMGIAILAEASLSFLGIGISPPEPAWGAMVSDGYRYLNTNPVLSFAPGVAVMLVVLAFNLVGDGLRDALDPRLRGVI
jgi:peptide/nickel transport system permease protein/oligopeptide transport system permease protein